MTERRMSLGFVWFSFEGRINRSVYYLWYVLPVLAITIVAGFLDQLLGTFYMTSTGEPIMGTIGAVVGLLTLWPAIAAGAKRCHDRNRSGWFQLVYLIPIVNLWPIVEIYFLRGTKGANRFGPDPLESATEAFTAPGLPVSHGPAVSQSPAVSHGPAVSQSPAAGSFSDSALSRG